MIFLIIVIITFFIAWLFACWCYPGFVEQVKEQPPLDDTHNNS